RGACALLRVVSLAHIRVPRSAPARKLGRCIHSQGKITAAVCSREKLTEDGVPAGLEKDRKLTESIQLVLAALLILQAKHFVADFLLQTPYQFLNKGRYGHPGGLIHAGIHALSSTLAFLVITPSLS